MVVERLPGGSWKPLTDVVAPEVRSRMMSGIRGVDTKPEMLIRRGLHARGWRYLLHVRGLPGKPDLVFPKRRVALFVHGCFWHGHDCPLFRWPGTRAEFWRAKIMGNIARDMRARSSLIKDGWRVLEVWECTLKGRAKQPLPAVLSECEAFLTGTLPFAAIGDDQTVTVTVEASE